MYNHDKNKCKCAVCQGRSEGLSDVEAFERLRKIEAEKIAEYGWLIHVVSDTTAAMKVNIHTHGIAENFGHPDLQILVPMSNNQIHSFFNEIVNRIKAGDRFSDGDEIPDMEKIRAVAATESGRTVIRFIFPDENGSVDPSTMEYPYNMQYADLVELKQESTGWIPHKKKKNK